MTLSQFLILLDTNDRAIDYVIAMPPPNYIIYRYSDWFIGFI